MSQVIKEINIFYENRFVFGNLYFDQKINKIEILNDQENKQANYLIPSFIDTHIHGGYRIDFNKLFTYSEQEILEFIKQTKKEGVFRLFITTVSDSLINLKILANKINALIRKYDLFVGWHLEGPFISKMKRGAHEETLIQPINKEFLDFLVQQKFNFPILITFASEVDNNLMLAKQYQNHFYWSIGHTNANYKEAEQASKCGFNRYTHVFNAMNDLNHKYDQASIINYILNNQHASCEVISDFIHVNASSLKVLVKCLKQEQIMIISDALNTKGMRNGFYKLNNLDIYKDDLVCYLKNTKTLAGGCAKYNTLVQNYFKVTNNMQNVVFASSLNANNYFHLEPDLIKQNNKANFVILDNEANLLGVYENGNKL